MKHRKFTGMLPLSLLVAIGILGCDFSFAKDIKHPPKGSVQFGSQQNPASGTADKMGSFKTVFADIAQKVVPTVVSVIPTKIDTVVFQRNPFYNFFGDQGMEDDPFSFFFGPPRQQQRRSQPQVEKQERREQGLGSGVIVSKDGYILTNFHVVSGADEIAVKLNDGREFAAKVVGSDSLSDVAVLKIEGKFDSIPVAYLGDSDKLRPGDWVIAIGNPFSLTSTVTSGIVSALGRSMGGPGYQNFIQTDAAINPGNSGGALVNIEGELIGINTMIYTRSGGYMGIGFAIPIGMAKRIMEDLIYRGEVVRGWIGVSIQDIDPATREALDLGNTRGVLIADVQKGQPAEKAGIKRGDIVLSINDKEMVTVNDLRNSIAAISPDTKVPVVVLRNGKKVDLKLTIGQRDEKTVAEMTTGEKEPEAKEQPQKKLGITTANLTSEIRQKYEIADDVRDGVVVVEAGQSAGDGRTGLRPGDVIVQLKVRGKEFSTVKSVNEFQKLTRDLKKGDTIMLLVYRGGNSFYTAFKLRE
jgi:serine protease Do